MKLWMMIVFLVSACQHRQELFVYENQSYAVEDFPKGVRQKIFAINQKHRQQLLEEIRVLVIEKYIREKASKSGKRVEQVRDELFSAREIDEDELREFYEIKKDELPYSYNMIRDEIRDWLSSQFNAERRQQVLSQIEKEKQLKLLLPNYEPPKFVIETDGFPQKGAPKAPIVLVEYADFTCPICKRATKDIEKILQQNGHEVRFVYKYFPLGGEKSNQFARGGYCAQKQNQFWAYHDYVFENQYKIIWDGIDGVLKHLKDIDESEFRECLTARETFDFIAASKKQAYKKGVNATPSFFVNGKLVYSGTSESDLDRAIKIARADSR